jgi:hypothetical protein
MISASNSNASFSWRRRLCGPPYVGWPATHREAVTRELNRLARMGLIEDTRLTGSQGF